MMAQRVYNSSGKAGSSKKRKKHDGYDPALLVLGGGMNVGYSGDYANLGISPKVGYKLTDFLAVGVGLGYQYYKAPDFYFNDKLVYLHQNIVFPALWMKCMVYKNVYIAGDLEYNFIKQRSYAVKYNSITGLPDDLARVKLTASAPCALVGLGYKQSLGGRTTAVFEAMYDAIQDNYSPYRNIIVYRAGIFVGL